MPPFLLQSPKWRLIESQILSIPSRRPGDGSVKLFRSCVTGWDFDRIQQRIGEWKCLEIYPRGIALNTSGRIHIGVLRKLLLHGPDTARRLTQCIETIIPCPPQKKDYWAVTFEFSMGATPLGRRLEPFLCPERAILCSPFRAQDSEWMLPQRDRHGPMRPSPPMRPSSQKSRTLFG